MSVTFHDQFCGAGGTTEGAIAAGATPVLGMNHWQIACDTYGHNHAPHGADVVCADVVSYDPRRLPNAEMLLTSPECTHHSYARGRPKDDPSLFDPEGDQGAERSRATMWDVPRYAEHHEYRIIVVENVEAAVKWGLPKGAKLSHGSYGPLFAAWLNAMDALGYRHRLVHLNSMVCGVPQSRDRLYVVFWRKGQREPELDIPAPCWCLDCERVVEARQRWKREGATYGTYGVQYDYACPTCQARAVPIIVPAAAAIDFALPAERIGDRKTPLKPNTLARIRRGLDKMGSRPMVAMLVTVGGNTFERGEYARVWPGDHPLPTQHRTADKAIVVSNMEHNVPKLAEDPMGCITTGQKLALVMPTTHIDSERRCHGTDEPLPSQTARQEQALIYAGRSTGVPRVAGEEPMQTQTAINSLYVVEPFQVPLRTHGTPKSVNDSLGTVSARGNHHGLAYVVANYNPGWVRESHSDVFGTVTATDHHALFTYRRGDQVKPAGEPLDAVSTVETHALVGGVDPATIPVEDCSFRMLQPDELKLGSSFPSTYTLYGAKRDQVAQIGNAVTPKAARELVARVIASVE